MGREEEIVNLLSLLESAELCHYYIIHFNLFILTHFIIEVWIFIYTSFQLTHTLFDQNITFEFLDRIQRLEI